MTKLAKYSILFVSIWYSLQAIAKDLEILDLDLESVNDIESEIRKSSKEESRRKFEPSKTDKLAPDPQQKMTDELSLDDSQPTNEVDKAIQLYHEKKYKEASQVFWKNVTLLKKRDLLMLARCHEQMKDADNTLRATTLIISKDEKSFEAYSLQGLAYLEKLKTKESKELYAQALESFKKSIELNSKYQPAYNGIALIYEKKKNNYELRALYQDMIKELGEKPEFYKKLCDVNTRDASHEQALQACKKGRQLDPSDSSYLINTGLVYKQQKEVEASKKEFINAAKRFPREEATQYHLGQMYEDQKNFIEAFEAYNRAVKIDPLSDRALVGLGTAAYQIQKFEIALDALSKACRINKKNALHARKANIYMRSNKLKEWGSQFQDLADKCNEL